MGKNLKVNDSFHLMGNASQQRVKELVNEGSKVAVQVF